MRGGMREIRACKIGLRGERLDAFGKMLQCRSFDCVTASLRMKGRSSGDDLVGAHHLVVFVFQNVAMPDVAEFVAGLGYGSRGEIELRDDASDIARICLNRILPGRALVRFGGHWDAGINDFAAVEVSFGVEGLPIKNLELYLMDVHRMDVAGGVGEGPDLHRAGFWVFCDGIVPVLPAE